MTNVVLIQLFKTFGLLERIVQGKQNTKFSPSRTITYNTSFLTQFRWVLKRTFRNLILNPQTSIAQVETPVELQQVPLKTKYNLRSKFELLFCVFKYSSLI